MKTNTALLLALPLTLAASPEGATAPKAAPAPIRIDVSKEKVGTEPKAFVPMVGNWIVATEDGRSVVVADGRQWKKGDPSGGLAEKARALYGSRHEEFLDNVKAFAYYPYAVATAVDDFRDGEISLRFKLLEGTLDQCAGILFNLRPNGNYLAVRVNSKEDNLVLWTFNEGKRKFVKKGMKNVPIPMKTWHTIRIVVKGTQLEGYQDDEKLLEYTLPEPVSGKVGVWSKTDSVTAFEELTVTPR